MTHLARASQRHIIISPITHDVLGTAWRFGGCGLGGGERCPLSTEGALPADHRLPALCDREDDRFSERARCGAPRNVFKSLQNYGEFFFCVRRAKIKNVTSRSFLAGAL